MLGTTQRSRERRGGSPGWAGKTDRHRRMHRERQRKETLETSWQLRAQKWVERLGLGLLPGGLGQDAAGATWASETPGTRIPLQSSWACRAFAGCSPELSSCGPRNQHLHEETKVLTGPCLPKTHNQGHHSRCPTWTETPFALLRVRHLIPQGTHLALTTRGHRGPERAGQAPGPTVGGRRVPTGHCCLPDRGRWLPLP